MVLVYLSSPPAAITQSRPPRSMVYSSDYVTLCCPEWKSVVDDVRCWLYKLLDEEWDHPLDRGDTTIRLPTTVGCPNGNPPKLNFCSGCALRLYFGETNLSPEEINKKETITMVAYAVGSGVQTVGTMPTMVKSYPVELVPELVRLLKVVNQLISEGAKCFPDVGHEQLPLNHVEIKFYFGEDVITQESIIQFGDLGIKDRPMRFVHWHCDWLDTDPNNSIDDNSVVVTLSIGDPGLLKYKLLHKVDGKWVETEEIFPYLVDHGSLSRLDPRDENGKEGIKFKHMATIDKDPQFPEFDMVGKGIRAAVVLRRSSKTADFWGPSSKTPFAKVVAGEDIKAFSLKKDGTPKAYNGPSGKQGMRFKDCQKATHKKASTVVDFTRETLLPNIRRALEESVGWNQTEYHVEI